MNLNDENTQIRDVLYRYARGVDRRDWEMVRDTYHPDAHDDHGSYKGNVPGLLEWLSRRHAHIEQSMHFIGNCLIEHVSEDTALVEAYCTVFQRYGQDARETIQTWLGSQALPANQKIKVELICRYVDIMKKTGGRWQIFDRTVVMEEVKMRVDADRLNSAHAMARRDRDDILWCKQRALKPAAVTR